MSWPSDGGPRYLADVQSRQVDYPAVAVVYDRAVCHRVVFATARPGRDSARVTIAEVARREAERLNAA